MSFDLQGGAGGVATKFWRSKIKNKAKLCMGLENGQRKGFGPAA